MASPWNGPNRKLVALIEGSADLSSNMCGNIANYVEQENKTLVAMVFSKLACYWTYSRGELASVPWIE